MNLALCLRNASGCKSAVSFSTCLRIVCTMFWRSFFCMGNSLSILSSKRTFRFNAGSSVRKFSNSFLRLSIFVEILFSRSSTFCKIVGPTSVLVAKEMDGTTIGFEKLEEL